jgi:hypothetical protein
MNMNMFDCWYAEDFPEKLTRQCVHLGIGARQPWKPIPKSSQ